MNIKNFARKKEYLICVDSDGCAMDTMDIKHFRAFGPCMVNEWELWEWRDEILRRWNDINLYTITRGINRFKGLAMALSEINEKYTEIQDVDSLVEWVENADELSNSAIERHLEMFWESVSLKKALSWSRAVNNAVNKLHKEEIKPFPLVREALALAHLSADVAVVSGANLGAVVDEWTNHGLIEHVDVVMAQDSGNKASCIASLLKKGYSTDKVIMCGDALGDLAAAEKNGVLFFPILVHREKESWSEFMNVALPKLLSGEFDGDYGNKKKIEFEDNLK